MVQGEECLLRQIIVPNIRKSLYVEQIEKRVCQYVTFASKPIIIDTHPMGETYELGEKKMDVILVIGGYKSSNTGHLAEIASEFCPAYHVEDATSLISPENIRHKKTGAQDIVETEGWLQKRGPTPPDHLRIGITAGASTPNRVVEEVIQRLIDISGALK